MGVTPNYNYPVPRILRILIAGSRLAVYQRRRLTLIARDPACSRVVSRPVNAAPQQPAYPDIPPWLSSAQRRTHASAAAIEDREAGHPVDGLMSGIGIT